MIHHVTASPRILTPPQFPSRFRFYCTLYPPTIHDGDLPADRRSSLSQPAPSLGVLLATQLTLTASPSLTRYRLRFSPSSSSEPAQQRTNMSALLNSDLKHARILSSSTSIAGLPFASDSAEDKYYAMNVLNPLEVDALFRLKEEMVLTKDNNHLLLSSSLLLHCLRSRDLVVSDAHIMVTRYIAIRLEANWRLSSIKFQDLPPQVWDSDVHWLGGRDSSERPIFFFNPTEMVITQSEPIASWQLMATFLLEHIIHSSYRTQISGVTVVIDCKGVGLMQLASFGGPSDAKRGMACWNGAFPIKLHKAVIVNCPSFAESVVSFCLTLVNKKLQDRIVFGASQGESVERIVNGVKTTDPNLDGYASVRQLAEKNIIPQRFGGDCAYDWQKFVRQNLRVAEEED